MWSILQYISALQLVIPVEGESVTSLHVLTFSLLVYERIYLSCLDFSEVFDNATYVIHHAWTGTPLLIFEQLQDIIPLRGRCSALAGVKSAFLRNISTTLSKVLMALKVYMEMNRQQQAFMLSEWFEMYSSIFWFAVLIQICIQENWWARRTDLTFYELTFETLL